MTTLATREFERYVADQTANRGSVAFDEMIFANIPNLTAGSLINHLRIPAANHIVHRQAISQAGVVNENAVVYSVTMGTEIGDFDFNFIGLVNRSRNLLAVAVYTDTIKKTKNRNGVQGNSITRSILLQFTGAKQLTNLSVSAETWQIDFTSRLRGLDEKIRLTNRDLYGRAIFFDNGFKVTRGTGNQYLVEVGNGYIEGVRADNKTRQTLTVRSLPCSIYVDLVHHCTVTGAYQTDLEFLQISKNDWVDTAGYQHYVQILADIDRNGVVTDRRILSPFLGITPKDLDEDSRTERDHTGHSHRLPLATLLRKGITKLYSGLDSDAEDMAATPRAIKRLKDLIDANIRNFSNFITNSKKSNAVDSSSSDTVATSFAVKKAYDLAENAIRIDSANKNINLTTLLGQNTVWGTAGRDRGTTGFSSDIYNYGVGLSISASYGQAHIYVPHSHAQRNSGVWVMSAFAGNSAQPLWRRIDGSDWDDVREKPTTILGYGITDAVNKSGDTMTGRLALPQLHFGSYAQQKDNEAPFFVKEHNANGSNTYFPALKTRVRNGDGWIANFSFGYTTPNGRNQWGEGIILLNEDNGHHRYWRFRHNGDFLSPADVVADNGYRLKNTHQVGNAYVDTTIQNDGYGGVNIRRRGTSGNWDSRIEPLTDKRWKFWVQNSHEIFLPAKGGTVLLEGDLGTKTKSLVSRRDYSRRINGTAAGQTGNQMDVVGSVTIYPDGRITQILHLKHFRDLWFQYEDDAVGYQNGLKGFQIPLQLWTAMPHKVVSVHPQLVRATHPTSSVVYGGGEAAEHVCAWDLRKQGSSRDRVTINMSRFRGQHSEHIDMYVVVEGY